MAANTSPIFVLTPNVAEVTFVNADGTTAKDLVTGGTNGTKVFSINVCSDDTATVAMEVSIYNDTSEFLLGTIDVVTLSGISGALASVNLLSSALIAGVDADNELFIPASYVIRVGPKAAVTAALTVSVVCFAGDY